jgi:hypothetical protein
MNNRNVIHGAGIDQAELAAETEWWRQRRTRGALTASEAARQNGLSRHRCGQVSIFWPWDRVTLEARQTLTTLEAIRPDRGWRSCERAALHGGAGRTRSPW